jgi:hypothetical protein
VIASHRRAAGLTLAIAVACGGQGSGPQRAELTDAIVADRGGDRACVAAAVENIDRSYLDPVLRLVRNEVVDDTYPPGVLEAVSDAYDC